MQHRCFTTQKKDLRNGAVITLTHNNKDVKDFYLQACLHAIASNEAASGATPGAVGSTVTATAPGIAIVPLKFAVPEAEDVPGTAAIPVTVTAPVPPQPGRACHSWNRSHLRNGSSSGDRDRFRHLRSPVVFAVPEAADTFSTRADLQPLSRRPTVRLGVQFFNYCTSQYAIIFI